MNLISVRERPEYADAAIRYFQEKWATPQSMMVYEDCIRHCLNAAAPLPQWYLLYDGNTVAGGAGLIPNDFISRSDLYPWFCALYMEEFYRGHAYPSLLMEKAKEDCRRSGFSHLYLCTDHVGYYERYGFEYIGTGYDPFGGSSRIYQIAA